MPCTSILGASVAIESKLITIVDSAPPVCVSTPVTWVATCTGIRSPARGPDPIVRSGAEVLADPITEVTAPSRVTNAVR